MALVRGGWLWRQSSILRRWKRNWFALWLDGTLGYYHDETAQDEEDRVLIHFNVRDIKVGQECHDVQPPEGRSRDGLLTVNLREGSRLHLCAETRDDAVAWKTALLEANSTPGLSVALKTAGRRRPQLEPPSHPGAVGFALRSGVRPSPGSPVRLRGGSGYVCTARIRTTMKWCLPTRTKPHMSAAATTGHLMQALV
ncbi:pleckstrin homology domain-containing family B member 1 isoform X2 [Mesocricetus auratus]|uniref:Pleckstrin homology domain-containing family B member 1 isoform X2 n=1 Tax=Mesocricetus auratus TaxID=10036 RepID=A0A3Q0CRV8_MESAU|nr:pleckstrin homology domain-containing family B member 1 isoform X2 [Mesocricetus auratus]